MALKPTEYKVLCVLMPTWKMLDRRASFGFERILRLMLTICKSFVPVTELIVLGRVRTSITFGV